MTSSMQRHPNDILDSLNPEQKLAVETTVGPVLVLAGAGTGKTRVLTTRLSHILASGDVFPSQLLAVTFTNKAANEMRERVAKIVGRATEGLWLGTFHSLALRMVRRHGGSGRAPHPGRRDPRAAPRVRRQPPRRARRVLTTAG